MVRTRNTDDRRRVIGIGLLLAVGYVIAARLGFRFAIVAEQVTTVWAPTGIAQACLLVWGRSLWPAVWIGAFVANAGTQVPLAVAAGIATGNTLEALSAAWVLQRVRGFDPALRRVADALAFIVIAALTSTAISATIGVSMLCGSGLQPWARFPALWADWWLGDALGALVVAPVLLTTARPIAPRSRRYRVEAALIVAAAAIVTQILFSQALSPQTGQHPLEYVIFSFVVVAAVRLGQPATALVVFAASAVTIWHTVRGAGPFAGPEMHHSLILLQAFMGVLAGTGLLLAAAIAERKRGEAALQEEQRRTRAILDSAPDAVIGMDHHGVITDFNPAAERIFGCSSSAAVGRELADVLIPRDLRASHRAGLARYLTTGLGPFIDKRIETIGRHANGDEFPVEVSITRVPGDPPTFTGFVRDLRPRVDAERERELLLERESAARREAETANRAKDDFLATLSHELRTPLNAIVGWTRMLLDGKLDPQNTTRALEVIDRNARLQVKLVADILDVSQIITGGLTLDVRPVDLGAVIGSAMDSMRPAADAKKIRICSNVDPAARMTDGDPQRLQQVMWNLLANAVKFTRPDGVIDVELQNCGTNGVRIRVTDDGEGIGPEFLPHVFERFRQADGSVRRQHSGLGLGLAIVRHLVELHGGTVRAESAGHGKGSTFTIELPKARADRAASTPGVDRGGAPPTALG